MEKLKSLLFILLVQAFLLDGMPELCLAVGNYTIDNYATARRLPRENVYRDYRRTIYCDAEYDHARNIRLPKGFTTPSHHERALREECEHLTPAENFGQFFPSWREGHPACVDSSGKPFKGRKCAGMADQQYRFMEADMYNLAPAIGAVNALRRNYSYAELPGVDSTFGS